MSRKKKRKFIDGLKLSLYTIIITAIIQNIFCYAQGRIEYKRDIRKNQMEVISDLVEETAHIEMLREKIYWNKFFAQLEVIIENNQQSTITISSKDYINLENEYRKDYEEMTSKYKATLIKTEMYFENSKFNISSIEDNLNKGFNYDSDYIETQYNELSKQEPDGEKLYNRLEELAKEKYNKDFFNISSEYAKQLKDEVK